MTNLCENDIEDEAEATTEEEFSDEEWEMHGAGYGPPPKLMQNVGGFLAKQDDKIGMTLIMEPLFRTSSVDVGALADLVISQNYVGCVSKPTDDVLDDLETDETFGAVCGVTSLINMVQHKDVACVKQIADWLKLKANECGSESDKAIMNGLFDPGSNQTPGLLIKERVLNLPPVLMMVELVSLKKDVTKALAQGKPFQTTHIIQMIKLFKTPAGDLMFSHEEECIAVNHAVSWFDYSIPMDAHGPILYVDPHTGQKHDCQPIRRVVVIPTSAFMVGYYADFEAKVKEISPQEYFEDPTL